MQKDDFKPLSYIIQKGQTNKQINLRSETTKLLDDPEGKLPVWLLAMIS